MKRLLPAVLLLIAATSYAQTPERSIHVTVDINAPVDTVWSRWTSPDGIRRFFAAQSRIELETPAKNGTKSLATSAKHGRSLYCPTSSIAAKCREAAWQACPGDYRLPKSYSKLS